MFLLVWNFHVFKTVFVGVFGSHTLRYIKMDKYYHGVPARQLVAHYSCPEASLSTHRAKGGLRESLSLHHVRRNILFIFSPLAGCFIWVGDGGCETWLLHDWHISERVHGLEFTEGLDRGDVFLLGASPHACLALLRLLSLYQRLLLRGLHAPGHHGWVNSCCAVHLLVFGGSYIRCLDSQHDGIHEVLGGLDQGSGTIELQEGTREELLRLP